jgi:hypothetical protein
LLGRTDEEAKVAEQLKAICAKLADKVCLAVAIRAYLNVCVYVCMYVCIFMYVYARQLKGLLLNPKP